MLGSDVWMDGVAFIHQCPLQNVKGFGPNKQEIKFRVVDGPGSFWYHGHSGRFDFFLKFLSLSLSLSRLTFFYLDPNKRNKQTTGVNTVDGVFGPLIIRPPRVAKPGQAGATNDVGPGKAIEREYPVLFGDWFHASSAALAFQLGRPFDTRKANATTGEYDWVNLPQAMHVNGRGIYHDCALKGPTDNSTTCSPLPVGAVPAGRSKYDPFATPSSPGCSRTNFTVAAGKKYLFRLVNVGSLTDASLCFGGHDRVPLLCRPGR